MQYGKQAYYCNNAEHPLNNIRLNKKFAEQLIPLLKCQPYINEAKIYEDEAIDVDLDEFRNLEINQSQGHIARWYFYAFLADYDLSKSWITVDKIDNNYVLVNRTQRYKNISINYKFLNNYKNIAFIGMQSEWELFKKEVPNCEFLICDDFLKMAKIIAGCRLFIGNQSFAYALAESIKVPRVLEVCPFAPNVIPHGEKAWDFYTQQALEIIVDNFLKEYNV